MTQLQVHPSRHHRLAVCQPAHRSRPQRDAGILPSQQPRLQRKTKILGDFRQGELGPDPEWRSADPGSPK